MSADPSRDATGSWTGRSAIVTGGGTGIGAATARKLAGMGAHVVVLGPDAGPLREVAAVVGGTAVVGDAADPASVQDAIVAAREATGGLDGLVACAGISPFGSALDTDDALWSRVTHVNLDTAFVSARECLPALVDSRGTVTVIASLAGLVAVPNAIAYTTTKHALIGLVRSIAGDYGPQGVRANVVCPGFVRTAMSDSVMGQLGAVSADQLDDAYVAASRFTPLRQPATPEEIAEVIAFLAGPASSAITGSVLVADGGISAIEVSSLAAFA